jgi:hypothetical protein
LVDGHEALLTVRGMTPEAFKANLAAVRGLLDPPQPTATPGQDWCKVHEARMQRHENDKGSWFSHYIDGRHCKGK